MKKGFWCFVLLLLFSVVHANTVTYVYTDQQGTPLAEADANGNITATFDYSPYGSQAMGSPPNGPGYTGHVNDPDTGLVYMQARYYDPGTGRFLSTDPIAPAPGNAFNFNRYDYANDNPVVNVDPNGKESAQLSMQGAQALQTDLKNISPSVARTGIGIEASILVGPIASDALAAIRVVSSTTKNNDTPNTSTAQPSAASSGDLHAPGDVPDSQMIVRGGTGDMPAPGQVFSGSQGSSVGDAGKGVPYGQIRTSTAGEIRAGGGTVDVAPEPTRSGQINGQHVNVTEGGQSSTFSEPPQPNPAPKADRVQ